MAKRDPEEALLEALQNPLRRILLRRLVESEDRLGSRELARSEEELVAVMRRPRSQCFCLSARTDRATAGAGRLRPEESSAELIVDGETGERE